MSDAMMEMPRYQCNKVVHALKIKQEMVCCSTNPATRMLQPADDRFAAFTPAPEWWERFHGSPEDMGYYVVYEGGYTSWSPTKAFEDGYTRI